MNAWRFVWRRKWLVVMPILLFTTATSLVAYALPVRYRSEAVLRIVPPRVPESLIHSTVTVALDERLLTISQIILTRAQLERVIEELDLYQEERRGGIVMEEIVERMRTNDIEISMEGKDGVRLSFVGDDPTVVKEVTERLSLLFISENVRNRLNLAEGTNQFLEGALEALRRAVDTHANTIEQAEKQGRPLPRSQVLEYEEAQNSFRAMLAKLEEARLAAALEGRQIAERLELLEPARVPARPDGPERLDVTLFGASAGFGLGLVLLVASSMRRTAPGSAVTPPA
jgi:uncharacterized protein involved in exopolysaccharide biosynthesis